MNKLNDKEGPHVTHLGAIHHRDVWDRMENESRSGLGAWVAGFWSGGGWIPFWLRRYGKKEVPNINVKSPNA